MSTFPLPLPGVGGHSSDSLSPIALARFSDQAMRTKRSVVRPYAWLQENCPSVPIPQLHGFALSTGQTVCSHF